jgi:hypothetical protein
MSVVALPNLTEGGPAVADVQEPQVGLMSTGPALAMLE